MSRVFRDALVPILVQDDEGRVVEMNAEVERVLEWSRGELIGKSLKTVLAPEWYGEFDRIVEQCRDGKSLPQEEIVLVAKSGRRMPVLLTVSVLSGESEEGMVRTAVIAKDISELKRAEEALRRSERSLSEEKRRLEDKTVALQEILEQVEREKSKIMELVAAHVQGRVLPVLDRLEARGSEPSLVTMLRDSLKALDPTLGGGLSRAGIRLTEKETEVCRMLKGGLSSREISRALNCSVQTVEKHRKNIRKKLGIVGTGINLGSYLSER
jgi:PAS domain S-box-containing protein